LTLKVTNLENVNCTGLLQHSNQLLTHSFSLLSGVIALLSTQNRKTTINVSHNSFNQLTERTVEFVLTRDTVETISAKSIRIGSHQARIHVTGIGNDDKICGTISIGQSSCRSSDSPIAHCHIRISRHRKSIHVSGRSTPRDRAVPRLHLHTNSIILIGQLPGTILQPSSTIIETSNGTAERGVVLKTTSWSCTIHLLTADWGITDANTFSWTVASDLGNLEIPSSRSCRSGSVGV
jgi:hypothetical protein